MASLQHLSARISAVLNRVRAALEIETALELTLLSRRTTPPRQYTVSFPSRKKNGADRFTIFTQILSKIHYILSTGEVVTKRDLFYQDFPKVKSQCTIDNVVDDIAVPLGVAGSALDIVTAVN